VVITGGTAGVGRATARAFARHGDRVAVLARGEEGLAATRSELEALGATALAVSVDVAAAAAV
jgi:NADP-dependent 3-hydroxy acid dehydrogenase YdfG